MAPKRISVEPRSRRAPKGFVGSTYDALTSPENAAVVRSIALFGPVNDAVTICDQRICVGMEKISLGARDAPSSVSHLCII
ncbi:unnamed protein product [Fusarium graminearum]|nr:unnamed protein product [Fusarium graminearum]